MAWDSKGSMEEGTKPSDQEEGHYRWDRFWLRVREGEAARADYLAATRMLRALADREGIGFVELRAVHQRARNDPHPNAAGNVAMAENLYQYLLEHHGEALRAHRVGE